MINIPAGKQVIICENGKDICSGYQPLVLNNDVALQLSSQFAPIVDNEAIKWLTTASSIAQGMFGKFSMTGAFKQLSFKQWTGTSPLTFNFEVTLNSLKSGNKSGNIDEQAKMLMKLALPSEGKLSNGEIGLVAPGPSIIQAFKNDIKYGNRYSIRFGTVYCSSIIIESVIPTYSQEYVKLPDGGLQPLYITLDIGVSSIFTATQQMIDGFSKYDKSDFTVKRV